MVAAEEIHNHDGILQTSWIEMSSDVSSVSSGRWSGRWQVQYVTYCKIPYNRYCTNKLCMYWQAVITVKYVSTGTCLSQKLLEAHSFVVVQSFLTSYHIFSFTVNYYSFQPVFSFVTNTSPQCAFRASLVKWSISCYFFPPQRT